MCNRPRIRGSGDKAGGTLGHLPVEGGVEQQLAKLRGGRLYCNTLEYAMHFLASAVWDLLEAAARICVFREQQSFCWLLYSKGGLGPILAPLR